MNFGELRGNFSPLDKFGSFYCLLYPISLISIKNDTPLNRSSYHVSSLAIIIRNYLKLMVYNESNKKEPTHGKKALENRFLNSTDRNRSLK